MLILKNSQGKPDSMYSFAVVGFWITVVCVFLGMVKAIPIGDFVLELVPPDTTLVSALLAGTLVAYVTRMNKKQQMEHELRLKQIEKGNE